MKEWTQVISSFDVISFDVFDTLLLRPYLTQEDLWLDLGRRELGEKDAAAFQKARIAADKQTYAEATKRGGEHTLEEAYRLMPKRYASLMEQEEQLQRECLVANPEMLEVWQRVGEFGKKRVIVSDMYLARSVIEAALRENGIDGWDAIYVSGERQRRKSTGALYEIVKRDWGNGRILHVGDNAYSDVRKAKEQGLESFHYENIWSRFVVECPFVESWLIACPSHEKRKAIGVLTLGWHLYKCKNSGWTYWNRLGFLFGGVLGYLYVQWLVGEARKHGVKRLLFVARDGYVWQKICNEICPEIKTEYVYAPRAVSIAVLGAGNVNTWSGRDRQCYAAERLKDCRPDEVLKRYSAYLSRFAIGADDALVDGCSSFFSAQRLVEAACGGAVRTFYLHAMSPIRLGESLFLTDAVSYPFQYLSEFAFGAPEAPIKDVDADGPVYEERPPEAEAFKMSVSREIADGAVACAKFLAHFHVALTRQDWLDCYVAFAENLTGEDVQNLSSARNAVDVGQRQFGPAVRKLMSRRAVQRFGMRIGEWRWRLLPQGIDEEFWFMGRWLAFARKRELEIWRAYQG